VRYIRDWYVRREKRDNSAAIGDPEAGKVTVDISSDSTTTTQALDTDSSASLVVGNISSTLKKKKKHSAQVRIRQPLWAALASTKIVMVKEYETSHTAAESAGTNATDMNNLGNAPFRSEADRIWITYVGSDEVFFSTSFFPVHAPVTDSAAGGNGSGSAGDTPKPFYVKVNNTEWPSIRMNPASDSAKSLGQEVRWNGEISGLAPISNYKCQFLSTIDDTLLFSTVVRTLQSDKADLTPGLSPTPQVTGRPESPVTTLKGSIASSEIKLNEERNRQKRERKDQRTKLSNTRKEIERYNASIASTGTLDDRQKQKIQQALLHMKQAEEAETTFNARIASLDKDPAGEIRLYESAKSEIQSERDQHKKLRSSFNSAKQSAEQDVQSLKAEVAAAQSKSESKQARLTFLITKHNGLVDANAKGLDEVQRKEKERQQKRDERDNIKKFYTQRIMALDSEIADGNATLQALTNAITTLESSTLYAQYQSPTTSSQNLAMPPGFGEMVPESNSMNAHASPWNPPAQMTTYAGYSNGIIALPQSSTPQSHRTRGRSSSMLSNVSKFTQSSDEGQLPGGFGSSKLIWEDAREDRKGSSGSGSGSGSGAGSVVDPKSPTASNVKPGIW
jgi:DNA repair exonuclease SbcCD ATPase subunit